MHHISGKTRHFLCGIFLLAFAAAVLWSAPAAHAAKADRDDPDYMKKLASGAFTASSDTGASADTGSSAAGASADTSSSYRGFGKNPYTGKTYTQKKLAKGMKIVCGVDVSKWDGNINWKKARADGIRFAIIRIGYSSLSSGNHHKDPWYESNIRRAKAAGVKVGVYYFSQAATTAEAESEADYTLKLLGNTKLDFPVVFDSEDMPGGHLRCSSLSRTEYTAIVRAYCDRIQAAGRTPMVYSNLNGWTNYFHNDQLTSRYSVWFARYNTHTGYSGPYDIWQYSSSGHVEGIPGSCDVDFYYCPADRADEFSGTDGNQDEAAAVGMSRVTAKRSGKSILVRWGAVSGAGRYVVMRSLRSSGGFRKVGETTGLSFRDRSAERGRRYYYRVYAKTDQGRSRTSNTAYASRAAAGSSKVRIRELCYVRSGPSKKSSDIGWLPGGKKCRLLEIVRDSSGKDWYRIRVRFRGHTLQGYVSSRVAERI